MPLLGPPAAAAQGRSRCPVGRIRHIGVQSEQVFSDSAGSVTSTFYSVANWLHVETRERVIRRELLFREGECYDPFRLSESERLLRDFRFIGSAHIETIPRRNGNVDIRVATRDEWSLRIEPRMEFGSGLGFTGVALAEHNLWGTGRSFELTYIDRTGKDEIGATYLVPQFRGSRWNLELSAARTEPGWSARGLVGHPFVGLVGRWAAFNDVGYGERWFRYVAGDAERRTEVIVPQKETVAHVGGAMRRSTTRRGSSTKLGTYGFTLSYERLELGSAFFHDSLSALRAGLSDGEVAGMTAVRLRARETLRLNLAVGVRGLEFLKRRSLSTVRAEEDIGIGASADLTLGLAAAGFGSSDSHVLAAADVYAGARLWDGWYSLLQASFEGRRDYERREWRDMFGTLQWTNIWLSSPRNTVVLTGQWSAGWETTVPFQLTLGGPSGLAGYASHRFPGGARAVVRLENRTYWMTAGRLVDLGAVLFADVGHMWANGAVFAVNSGTRASIGAGIRLAAPSSSRFTYRFDIAAPLESGVGFGDLLFTFTTRRPLRLGGRPTDAQLERSRDVSLRTAGRHFR